MACRDLLKAEKAVEVPQDSHDNASRLGLFESVRQFVNDFRQASPWMVCNAAIYMPLLKEPLRSPEGFE